MKPNMKTENVLLKSINFVANVFEGVTTPRDEFYI